MPTPLMKSFAKKAHKKSKTVEKLWKKSEKLVKSKYEIDEESSRFYPLVVGTLKHLLGLSKDDINEEDESASTGEMTTTNMGDYVYPTKLGVSTRMYPYKNQLPMEKEIKKINKLSKKFSEKEYDKLVRQIVYNINYMGEDVSFDEVMSDVIEYYCSIHDDPNDVLDASLEAVGKYYGVVPSLFDDLK